MPMYTLAIVPPIKKLKGSSKHIWYADDAAAPGKIADLRVWWDLLTSEGPYFGYFPNPCKMWLITKEGFNDAGISSFTGTGVSITSDGRPYLGVAIGSVEYVKNYVKSEVSSRLYNVSNLNNNSKDSTTRSLLSSHSQSL